jgi:predicted nucleotidyltransferase
MTTEQEQRLRQITQTLVERIRPEKIVLFGSLAIGKSTEKSDVDLLVILESDLRRDKRQEFISRALRPRTFPIDILAYTPAEVRACTEDRHSFLNYILKTGRVLYERQGSRAAEAG